MGRYQSQSANGTQRRDTVVLVVIDDDDELELEVSITNREHMAFPVILGRDYLGNGMNIADAARFIADGMVMKIELSESVDKKVDEIREEVKAITKDAVDKIDRSGTLHRYYLAWVLLETLSLCCCKRPCQVEPGVPAPQARVLSKLHYKGLIDN